MSNETASREVKDNLLDEPEVQRLISLTQSLGARTVEMIEGDLLLERIKINRALLPSTLTDAVYAQICETMQSRRQGAIRFAASILVPLVGTRPLAAEQLQHLVTLLHRTSIDSAATSYDLCWSNASEMEQIVSKRGAVADVLGVYCATGSALLLERLLAEAEKTLGDKHYRSSDYFEETKRIFSAILDNASDQPPLRDLLLRLLRASKPDGPLRDYVEEIVAGTRDITLCLPLLLAFAADLAAYVARYRTMDFLMEQIPHKRERHEQLLAGFQAPEGAAVRSLYDLLLACRALPPRSDHARLEIRRRAIAPADVLLKSGTPGILVDFTEEFATGPDGQTDIVYILSCLPTPLVAPFLQVALQRPDLSDVQHAALALALSYVTGGERPADALGSPIMAPVDDSTARTWWGDQKIESACVESCARAAAYLGRILESSTRSHEERLTGMFLTRLQSELQQWAEAVEPWAARKFGRYSRVHCSF